ncbi:MAG: hypothetical protein NVSMB32_07700 [Actinomycetota bacterium]
MLRAKVAALVELMNVKERLEHEVAERTASEALLSERERQLAEAESLAHVGAWRWDPATGEVAWSDELFRIFGLAPQSIPLDYETYRHFIYPDDRAMVEATIQRAYRTGESYVLEHRAVRADGSIIWIRGQGQLVGGGSSAQLFGAAQDITQRKRAEEEFTQFFNLSLDLMAVTSLEGKLVRVNRSFTLLLGWSQEELLSRSYLDLVHEQDRRDTAARFAGLRQGSEMTDHEVRMVDHEGGYRWCRVSARPVPEDGVAYVVAIDITERKRAAMLLAESEGRYRVLVEHAPEAIVVLDLDSGRFVDVNAQAERLFGMGRSQLCGMGPGDVSPPRQPGSGDATPAGGQDSGQDGAEGRDAPALWIERALGGNTDPFEWVLKGAGGAPVLCEIRLLELPAAKRRLARGSLIDITERRKLQEAQAAVAERDRELRQSQQIAQTLQRSLLPEELPEIPTVGLAARYLPGSAGLEVGGDWYDVMAMPSGAVALAIGDVVGRGLLAAATMGQLRTALRAYALEDASPGRVIERLGGLAKGLREAEMTTLVSAVYQPGSGLLTYMCAGHPPPLLVRPGGEASFLEGGRVTPLGVPTVRGQEGSVLLDPGSVLILYTDGLIERPGSSLDAGMLALVEAVRAVPDASPEALCDAITAALIGDSSPGDDVALLVVSCAPALSDTFRLSMTTDPQRLGGLRHAFSGWLTHLGASAEERGDLILAVSEAVTNSMVHAYGPEDGTVEVEARHDGGAVTVTVSDRGTWRSRETSGGRGLLLMQALVESCDLVAGEVGTEVRMLRHLGRPMSTASSHRVLVPAEKLLAGYPTEDEVVAVAHLEEDIDASNVARIGAALVAMVGSEQLGLVVDASALSYLDSSGIRLLFDLQRRLERRRQALWAVVPPDSALFRLMELTQVAGAVPLAGSVEEAVASMREHMGPTHRALTWPQEPVAAGGRKGPKPVAG